MLLLRLSDVRRSGVVCIFHIDHVILETKGFDVHLLQKTGLQERALVIFLDTIRGDGNAHWIELRSVCIVLGNIMFQRHDHSSPVSKGKIGGQFLGRFLETEDLVHSGEQHIVIDRYGDRVFCDIHIIHFVDLPTYK